MARSSPLLTEMLQALDDQVRQSLPQTHEVPELQAFYRLVRDYPERGGKRLRGLLVLLSAATHGLPWRHALPVAAALELFQNWILIHDDIEDGSEERRGAPALHRMVSMPVALNVGDALHIYMWDTLHRMGLPPERKQAILQEFVWMIHRTAEGQHLDLVWIQEGRFDIREAEYLRMVTLKTAHYTVACPLRLGALCAGLEPDERLRAAGVELGAAFQIRDDVLNLMPDIRYGKEFAGDLFEAKRTLILAHLFAHVSPETAQEVEAVLGQPRVLKRAEQVKWVLGVIGEAGSLNYAQAQAQASADRGLTLLRDALAPLPGQAEAAELTGLLESLARRTH